MTSDRPTASTDEREDEPEMQRLDRHWGELLQELRVVQGGVQILAGLLFTVPFQARFTTLSSGQVTLYLVAVSAATLSAMLLISPVPMHRILFRRRRRRELIEMSDAITKLGLAALACSLVAVLCLVFSVVASWTAALVAAIVAVVFAVMVWVALPLRWARQAPDRDER